MSEYLFLSYAAEDRPYVEQLAQRLKTEAGVESWWFQGKQEPGVPYMQELIRRIQGCLAVVVVLSPASASSVGVDAELGLARAERKRIIPIVIGHSSDESLTSHVRAGEVTYALRRLDMIDGNKPAEIIPRLRRFLQVATQPRPDARSTAPGLGQEPVLLTGHGAKGYKFGTPVAQTNSSVVYKAQELAVGRDVAIKVVLPSLEERALYRRRFEQEARRVASLEHPYIVPLYNYWSDDEDAYLVMRWMPGGNLGQLIAGRQAALTPQATARIFTQVVDALAFAHAHGVIHRDLKPGNILTDQEGNAYLSDFGIAQQHKAGGKPSSASGGYTIGYAPPEQIADIAAPARVQNDIYALGAVLYELITGEPAFSGANKTTILQRQMSGEVPSLLRWGEARGRALPTTLDAAINRAMAYDPADRYPDVQGFADAVSEGFVAVLRGDGIADTAARSFVMPQARVGGANPYKALRPFDESDAADFFGREALAAQLAARLQRAGEDGRFLAVVGASGSGKSSVVRAGLVPGLRRQPGRYVAMLTPGERPVERLAEALAGASGQPAAELLVLLYSGEGGLVRAAGRVLAESPQAELLLVIDQFEELYTLLDDAEQRRYVLANLAALVADPRGKARLLITLRADFYDRPLSDPLFSRLMEGRTETVLPMSKAELEEAIVKPARRVGAAIEPALVREMLADVEAQPGALPLLQYALHALYERCGGAPLTLQAYAEGGGLRGALERQAAEVLAGLSAERQALARQIFLRLVTPGDGVEDTRRRVRRSELVALVAPPAGAAAATPAAAANLNVVLAAFGDKRLLTFDYEPGTREATVEIAHEALLQSWSDLRAWLREARSDIRSQRRLSDVAGDWLRQSRDPAYLSSGGPLAQFEELAQRGVVVLTPTEREFIAASRDAEAERQRREVAQAQALAEEQRLRADQKAADEQRLRRQAGVLRMLLAGAGVLALVALVAAMVAAINGRAAAQSAEAATQAQQRAEQNAGAARAAQQRAEQSALQSLTGDISARQPDLGILLNLAAEGMRAAGEAASSALLTTLTSQPELVGYLRGHIGSVDALAISPDGSILASAGSDHTIILWNLATRTPLELTPPLAGHRDTIASLAFSPDGRYLASAGADDRIVIWSAGTWTIHQTIEAAHRVKRVAFAPDGTLAWGQCVSLDGERPCAEAEIRFWSIDRGQPAGEPLRGHSSTIFDLAFNKDGARLISAGADETVRIWDIAERKELKKFASHTEPVYAVAFSPDGSRAASGGLDATLIFYNVETLEPIGRPLAAGGESVLALAYKPDGRTLLSAGFNDRILRWDTTRYPPTPADAPLAGHTNAIDELAFNREGTLMASGSRDGTVVLWDLDGSDLITTVANHRPAQLAGAVSPDGATLVTGGNEPTIQFWEVATGRRTGQAIPTEAAIHTISFSPSPASPYFATADTNGAVKVYSASGERLIWSWPTGAEAWGLAFSPDGQRLAMGNEAKRLAVLTMQGTIAFDTERYYTPLALAFHPNGRWLAAGGNAVHVEIWDLEAETYRELGEFTKSVNSLAFSPDGALLAAGSSDGTLVVWETESGAERWRQRLGSTAYHVAFSPDGQTLASGHADGSLQLWSSADGAARRAALTGHSKPITMLHFQSNDSLLANDEDGSLKSWSISAGSARAIADTAGAGTTYAVTYSPAGDRLISGGRDRRVIVSDPSGQDPAITLGDGATIGHTRNVLALAVSRAGLIASGGADGLIFLWDPASFATGAPISPTRMIDLARPEGAAAPSADAAEPERWAVYALAFGPDVGKLAAGDANGQVVLWDVATGKPEYLDLALDGGGHTAAVRSLAFSPDGRTLVSGSEDATTIIWDLDTFQQAGRLTQQGGEVYALAFSPADDAHLLATAGGDDKILLWDTRDWTPIGSPMIGHTDTIWGLAFSPDGRLLATGSEDGSILLWEVATQRPLGAPIRIGKLVRSVAFSPDGERLAFGAIDREVSVINISTDQLRERACQVVARTMRWPEWQTYQPSAPYQPLCPDQALFYGELIAQAEAYALAAAAAADDPERARLADSASTAYQAARVQALLTTSPILNNRLCWSGSINGFAEVVLEACQYAVELTAEGQPLADPALHAQLRDSYGLALARSGELAKAIPEIQAFVDWAQSKDAPQGLYERKGQKRAAWITALEKGEDPFTPEVLEQLRIE